MSSENTFIVIPAHNVAPSRPVRDSFTLATIKGLNVFTLAGALRRIRFAKFNLMMD